MDKKELSRFLKQGELTTPCYLWDYDLLREHLANLQRTAGDTVSLCYAMKANPFLVKEMEGLTGKIEVCSPGELSICKAEGVAGEHIIFSGVNKTYRDVEAAFAYSAGILTIESEKHFKLIKEHCERQGVTAKVLLRLTGGGQFGMEEDILRSIIENREDYPYLHIVGIHYFTGTQKKNIEKIEEEFRLLLDLAETLKTEYGYETKVLEFGPGLRVSYFEGEDFTNRYGEFEALVSFIREQKFSGEVVLEMGRFLAAACGSFLTRVEDTKVNKGVSYAIVDGGIHHLSYYGQNMAMRVPRVEKLRLEEESASEEKETTDWTICGSLCTFADVLVRKYTTDSLQEGDYLCFGEAGAYSVTEAPQLFLSRRLPNVYAYEAENGVTAKRQGVESYPWNCGLERQTRC